MIKMIKMISKFAVNVQTIKQRKLLIISLSAAFLVDKRIFWLQGKSYSPFTFEYLRDSFRRTPEDTESTPYPIHMSDRISA
ncbi:hypothetical protein [Paenibacillus sp. Soil787]|uniref:hypothetical protein n=1 Tax=Paenibacillus sp. Soil787 TaxID=1736411 RepID=UPI0007123547|nr:hypothetical protein [Paenibacillus sp. Soil787]KRF19191.1 hypothetical protein ASG93_32945 [Paenibacillus sp. Soil787]